MPRVQSTGWIPYPAVEGPAAGGRITCIGTCGKLGDPDKSERKQGAVATDIFGAPFNEPNPIRGTAAKPELRAPSHCPTVAQYLEAAIALRQNEPTQGILKRLGVRVAAMTSPTFWGTTKTCIGCGPQF